MDSHPQVLTVKSTRSRTTNTKTDIVVAIPRIVVVAVSRTAIPRIIDPRTAPLYLPAPVSAYPKSRQRTVVI
ncbi:hypothetical protein C7B64_11555 [Merismopedia glauca CCAP 1448/3]|uniref:Uncharacterized protein n=1 Tax=Merismopedia glauca CCAP 1448/3 TaxID=1296344 RepID=A0A2T1C3E3_9CYAN|nr:hypothetical protein C7B64_11555 [Merismopedia glauca CCAP 1448/3]